MNSNEVKKFLKSLKLPVRVRTIQSKDKWIEASIETDHSTDSLVFKGKFPELFCKVCNGVIYGVATSVGQQAYTNIANAHSISMRPDQWESAIQIYSAFPNNPNTPNS